MPNISIKLLGDVELQRRLYALPEKLQKKAVRPALKAAAKVVLATAKANCPILTGAMKRSLKVRALKSSRRIGANFGSLIMTGKREELGINPFAPGYYPMSVEFGHGNVPAHPFLRPALDTNRENVKGILRREISQRIELLAGK